MKEIQLITPGKIATTNFYRDGLLPPVEDMAWTLHADAAETETEKAAANGN